MKTLSDLLFTFAIIGGPILLAVLYIYGGNATKPKPNVNRRNYRPSVRITSLMNSSAELELLVEPCP